MADDITTTSNARLDRLVLEELVYESVRVTVDLCKLMDFQQDLSIGVERSLKKLAQSPEEKTALSLEMIKIAWARVGEELLEDLANFDPYPSVARRLSDLDKPQPEHG